MSTPTLADLMNPERMEKVNRYENWRTSVLMGWQYAKEMNCREPERYKKLAKELALDMFSQLEEGNKYLESEKKA